MTRFGWWVEPAVFLSIVRFRCCSSLGYFDHEDGIVDRVRNCHGERHAQDPDKRVPRLRYLYPAVPISGRASMKSTGTGFHLDTSSAPFSVGCSSCTHRHVRFT